MTKSQAATSRFGPSRSATFRLRTNTIGATAAVILGFAVLGLASPFSIAPQFAAAERELPRDWNEQHVGPSKHYKELDSDTLIKHVTSEDNDTVLVLYGDQCTHCQELKPTQDKAAKKIQEESSQVKFGRYDFHRFGGAASLLALMRKKFPNFETMEKEGKVLGLNYDNLAIPQMYHFAKGGTFIQQVPHGEIGWGPQGHKNLMKWIRASSNGGKYQKDIKDKARAAKKAEKAKKKAAKAAAAAEKAAAEDKEKVDYLKKEEL